MTRRKFNRFRVKPPEAAAFEQYCLIYPPKTLHFAPQTLPTINAETLFQNQNPLVIDLGCGRGEFVVAQAIEHPTCNFVGIDCHRKSIYAAVNRAQEQQVSNIRFILSDLRWVLQKVATASVQTIYLLFPAPVMKKKDRQRDVLTVALIEQLARMLRPGGHFHFATDADDYFQVKVSLIEAQNLFDTHRIQADFEGGLTRYQKFWEALEEKPQRAIFLKVP
jgi:tRNA (guanine-N7-)-methyltransferase